MVRLLFYLFVLSRILFDRMLSFFCILFWMFLLLVVLSVLLSVFFDML